jgi:hypothetical protein
MSRITHASRESRLAANKAMKSKSTSKVKRSDVAVDAFVRRFTADEKACIAHALDHLRANKIADDNYQHSGWYRGNREQFVKRHKKALSVLEGFLSPNDSDHRPLPEGAVTTTRKGNE